VGDFRGREKATKWWSDTGRGVTECQSDAGPCEDKVKLVPSSVGGRRRSERQTKCGKEVDELR